MNFPWNVKEKGVVNLDYKPTLSTDFLNLAEKFKGEVQQKKVKFPEELGEEHPFNFNQFQTLYEKWGFFTAVVDKYIDFVVGPGFFVTSKDDRATTIIEDFMRDVNFDTLLRQWTKEALTKGNGFIEIGKDKNSITELKILNANWMYVDRNELGTIEGYNQYVGGFDRFKTKKVVPFNIDEIAHVPFNLIGDNAYGLGIGYPAISIINNVLQQELDMHMIMNRKANSPLHAKLGKVDGNVKIIPKPADVEAFGKKMEIMSNKTEWATDDLVDLSVIDYGKMGEKFDASLQHDVQMLIYAFQIPPELMGFANIPEGMAVVRMDAFQRRIQSIQAELEKIIEQKIFKVVLELNGFDSDAVDIEFEWGAPSVIAIEARLKLVTELIKSPITGFAIKTLLEDELINLLKLDRDEFEKLKLEELKKEEEERKRLETQATPIVPGQNKGFPPKPQPASQRPKQPIANAKTKIKLKETKKKINLVPQILRKNHTYEYEKACPHCEEKVSDINDIQEWIGFNYKDYLKFIEKATTAYDFAQLLAVTETELLAGYLSNTQVESLRTILQDGFKKGTGLREMSKIVDKKVKPKDLFRLTPEGQIKTGASGLPILARTAEKRSINIIRSEVTRLANAGAVEYYKVNKISQVSWVASFGDRTCPDCEALNGQIFEINKTPDIPLHPMCRCTLTPVVELI